MNDSQIYPDYFTLPFPALVTDIAVGTDGVYIYSWEEEDYDPASGDLNMANPGRSGVHNAVEMNNLVVMPPFHVSLRFRGLVQGNPYYEFDSPPVDATFSGAIIAVGATRGSYLPPDVGSFLTGQYALYDTDNYVVYSDTLPAGYSGWSSPATGEVYALGFIIPEDGVYEIGFLVTVYSPEGTGPVVNITGSSDETVANRVQAQSQGFPSSMITEASGQRTLTASSPMSCKAGDFIRLWFVPYYAPNVAIIGNGITSFYISKLGPLPGPSTAPPPDADLLTVGTTGVIGPTDQAILTNNGGVLGGGQTLPTMLDNLGGLTGVF